MNRQVEILGYYVTQKPVRTKQGKLMAFGTWLDREGHFLIPPTSHRVSNITHFKGVDAIGFAARWLMILILQVSKSSK